MEQSKKINPYLIGGGALAALIVAFIVARGMHGEESEESGSPAQPVQTESKPETATPPALAKDVRFKVPVSTMQPFEGPADALVTVVEWCDMRGAVCRQSDTTLEELMKAYEGRLRRVYRMVPNSSRPEESKLIHQFARAAYEEEKSSKRFLEVRKQIMAIPDGASIGENELRPIAKKVGMDYDKLAPRLRDSVFVNALTLDGGFGVRFGIKQLPGIFVNGRPVQNAGGSQDLKAAVKQLIDEELVSAQKLVDQGTERAALYDKIVESGLWSVDDNPATRQAAAAATPNLGFSSGESARK
jgi:protein-disulfide isomerase